MKPNLDNDWGRAISNQIRSYLNLPALTGQDSGNINTVIGDQYLLVLEAAEAKDVALLALFKKVDRFSVGRRLSILLEQVSISKNLPVPVHIALKAPDSIVIVARLHKMASNQAARYLDMLFTIYKSAD